MLIPIKINVEFVETSLDTTLPLIAPPIVRAPTDLSPALNVPLQMTVEVAGFQPRELKPTSSEIIVVFAMLQQPRQIGIRVELKILKERIAPVGHPLFPALGQLKPLVPIIAQPIDSAQTRQPFLITVYAAPLHQCLIRVKTNAASVVIPRTEFPATKTKMTVVFASD